MFREYDLRGRVNEEELNDRTEILLGQAFGTYVKRMGLSDTMVVGYDFRSYTEGLKNAFAMGVISTGINVIDIGLCLTPLLYYAQYHFKTVVGAMITGSHNENGWSGVKFGHGYSQTLLGDELIALYDLIKKDDFETGQGTVRRDSVTEAYMEMATSKVRLARSVKVVVECGNGTAGEFAPELLRRVGCEVHELYCDLDATFPHHNPNPELAVAKKVLGEEVTRVGADIGMGYDGDGDRLGVCDERGANIWSDRLLILLARDVLQRQPGGKIVFDVKCTQALPEDIVAHGGIPIMWKTGHSYIKRKAQEEGAILAGERSGHFFIRDNYFGYDDSLFSSLKLLEILSRAEKPFSTLIADTPAYVISPTIHIHCDDDKKYDVVARLTSEFQAEYGAEKVIDINGARVLFGDGWGLVRASSNEPVLVVVVEAKTQKRLDEIKSIFKEMFARYPEIDSYWENDEAY